MPYTRFVRGSLLLVGLTLYGVSDAMLVLAGLGLDPWDVLHQGLSRSIGGQVGTWTDIIGVIVLLGWIPLRQRPGVGTVVNVILIGIVVNICLDLLPSAHGLLAQWAVMLSAVVLNAIATGLYIGAGLGPGAEGRLDDGHRRTRSPGPGRPDRDRGVGARARLAAGRHRRHRDRRLRVGHRATRAHHVADAEPQPITFFRCAASTACPTLVGWKLSDRAPPDLTSRPLM